MRASNAVQAPWSGSVLPVGEAHQVRYGRIQPRPPPSKRGWSRVSRATTFRQSSFRTVRDKSMLWRLTKNVSSESKLSDRALRYVDGRLTRAGGWKEALAGARHQTGPAILGLGKSLTIWVILALLFRFCIAGVTALFPILVRKVSASPGGSGPSGAAAPGWEAVVGAVVNSSPADWLLAVVAVALLFGGKLLDRRAKQESGPRAHTPYTDLSAAINKMPPFAQPAVGPPYAGSIDEGVRLCLKALKAELAELIGDDGGAKLTDVTMLVFCDPAGKQMQVRARTAENEPTHRPCSSEKFLAYYVAMRGRWFTEHNFRHSSNPFPKTRLTVHGQDLPVDYSSVLYLPIIFSDPGQVSGAVGRSEKVLDYCIGVICVHSAKPYRFWRWGDHKRRTGGLGDIAYQRSMPYISLITRLTEQTAVRVRLEAQ